MTSRRNLRGTKFLQAERPQAMAHLLGFYREAGKHLDLKTRHLVSIVTKVINFSPRGLRQYVQHAQDAGATRDEILDVILLAYPCAGLTRVNDAVDVILDMGIFATDDELELAWREVTIGRKPEEGELLSIDLNGRELLLIRSLGRLVALNARCPHQGGALSDGALAGDQLTCPVHGWCFRLSDGSEVGGQGSGVAVYEVRETPTGIEIKC